MEDRYIAVGRFIGGPKRKPPPPSTPLASLAVCMSQSLACKLQCRCCADDQNSCLFGVFDGHGGSQAAE
jgi:hypothetical protein